MEDKSDIVYKAKLAEQAERYDEMVENMKKIAKCPGDLSIEERNLLSVAYKNVIGARRASWRVLSSLEERQSQDSNDGKSSSKKEVIKKYREVVEKELKNICEDILKLLDENLIDKTEDEESRVFYHKMKGDYLRYKAEFLPDEEKNDVAELSRQAYTKANETAQSLPATHSIKLGLALNFSVFYYEILKNPFKAREVAKNAFDDAIAELDKLSEQKYKDSTLIMQLLRDNLTLWTSEAQGEEDMEVQDMEDKES